MARKPLGKSDRKELTLLQIADMFTDEQRSRDWIEQQRWPHGPYCPKCGSFDVQAGVKHKSMTHRCRDCRKTNPEVSGLFTVRTGTIMERTKMPYRTWAIGVYLYTTSINGISPMRLHNEMGITQKSAWFMLLRLRKAAEAASPPFPDPIERDETYMGDRKRKSKSCGLVATRLARLLLSARKTEISIKSAPAWPKKTARLCCRVLWWNAHRKPQRSTQTEDTCISSGRQAVKDSVQKFVRKQARTNGIESLCSPRKRTHLRAYHKTSSKHLDRCVKLFQHRHSLREYKTIGQTGPIVASMKGKRPKYGGSCIA